MKGLFRARPAPADVQPTQLNLRLSDLPKGFIDFKQEMQASGQVHITCSFVAFKRTAPKAVQLITCTVSLYRTAEAAEAAFMRNVLAPTGPKAGATHLARFPAVGVQRAAWTLASITPKAEDTWNLAEFLRDRYTVVITVEGASDAWARPELGRLARLVDGRIKKQR
ncbi:MAG TPA: hypothetical protein VKT52_09270 [Ktedonobacterales bacterium]|nr:hypothetical protein [Ktedonobacterales bacterium]